MAVFVENQQSQSPAKNDDEDFLFKLPDSILKTRPQTDLDPAVRRNSSAMRENRSAPADTRKQKPIDLPNLLKMSKIGKAVMKLAPPGGDGTRDRPRYSSTGHQCWSSLRTREWQEFQRSIQEDLEEEEEGENNHVTLAATASQGFLYFTTPSRTLSTRGSKRPIRKQVASPNSGIYERARLADFQRIENVYSQIKLGKTQRWRDIIEGVPSQYDSKIKPIKVKFIYETENLVQKQRQARKKLRMQDALFSDTELRSASQTRGFPRIPLQEKDADINRDRADGQERAQSGQGRGSRALCRSAGSTIPGPFVFPRAADFVPDDGTKVDKMGVDWKFAKCHRESASAMSAPLRTLSAPTAPVKPALTNIPSPPKMHKASYNPVTQALRREHQSTANIKGKVMTRDDLEVSKVWKRKLTNIIIPAHMARRDIPDSAIKATNRGRADKQCDGLDASDEDFSDDRQSLDRGDTSCDDEEEVGSVNTNS